MRKWLWVFAAISLAMPWPILRFLGLHEPPYLVAALSGLAILGSAFLLSWASEVVQLDISQALAVVILSLVAVLPEYSVDLYFAWRAGQDPAYAQFAIANMTGANRLLVGIGWSAVVFVFWWRTRNRTVELAEHESLEISVLAIATIYAFAIPLKGTLSIVDAVVLLSLFAVYAYVSYRQPPEEPELVGPAATIGALPVRQRRFVNVGLFVFAAIAILLSAEPFAEGLVATGETLHIDKFMLVQWLAPLASEAPEFIVALLFVLRAHPHLGLRTMVSSKVNQWTLLVGTLPLVFSLSAGRLAPLVLDHRQVEEVLLTAAQSALAVVLISGYGLSVVSALVLLTLFLAQFLVPEIRLLVSGVYLFLTVGVLALDRQRSSRLIKSFGRLVVDATRRAA